MEKPISKSESVKQLIQLNKLLYNLANSKSYSWSLRADKSTFLSYQEASDVRKPYNL